MKRLLSSTIQPPPIRAMVAVAVAMVVVAGAGGARAEEESSEDQRFLEGLRQRRMFQLAETFCDRQLQRQDLPDVERGQLTLELVRTLGRHALNSRSPDREALFKKAIDAADRFGLRNGDNPLMPLIRMQSALTALAQAEQARQEAEVGPDPQAALAQARESIRNAARALELLDKFLTQEIPQRRRNPPRRAGELAADELFSLQNNGRLQLARAYRNQALCYPAGSDDRIASVTQALQQLAEPLRELPADDPLAWQVKMARAVCVRILEDYPAAERLLAELMVDTAPTSIRQRALAERVRILLANKRATEAWRLVRTAQGEPELEFARLQTLAALLTAEKNEQTAAALRRDALAAVNRIEDLHGPYWGRRASQLLVSSATSDPNMASSGNVEILRRTAEAHYQKRQFDDAIVAYEKASTQAQRQGNAKSAFEFLVTAALIRREQGRMVQYSQRLRDASLKLSRYERAGDAHLAAIIATAQLKPPPLDIYEGLLAEHLDAWPQRESANQVRLWLARLRRSRNEYAQAVAALEMVAPDSQHFDEGIRLAGQYFLTWLQTEPTGQDRAQLADQAAIRFERVVMEGGAFPQEWSDLDRFCALTAARLRLAYRADDFARAEQLLTAALNGSRDVDPQWSLSAKATLVAAMAGQPNRRAAASQLMQSIAGAAPVELLELLENLTRIADTAAPAVKREIGHLQQNAVNLLQTNGAGLDAAQQLKLRRTRAEALAAVGDLAGSLREYERLAKENPRNARIQEGYAHALSGNDRTLAQALSQWRIVARGSKPGTTRWLDAKYQVARTLQRQGKQREATDRVRFLLETGNLTPQQKQRFEALLK
ncbi:MAG: hypothetical protein QGG36_04895 [Pirellulaceae bacterium]|nr:hypothetical protein [Pirellulaceae bacterium]